MDMIFYPLTDFSGTIYIVQQPTTVSSPETIVWLLGDEVHFLIYDWACFLDENACEIWNPTLDILEGDFFARYVTTLENGKERFKITVRTESLVNDPDLFTLSETFHLLKVSLIQDTLVSPYVNRVLLKNKNTGEFELFYENFYLIRDFCISNFLVSTRHEFHLTNDLPILNGMGFDNIVFEAFDTTTGTTKFVPSSDLSIFFKPQNYWPANLKYTVDILVDSSSWRIKNQCCR
jgi:hypothetical protein